MKHDNKSPFLNLPPAVSVALQKGAQWGFTSSSIYLLSHPHDDESGDDSLNYSKTIFLNMRCICKRTRLIVLTHD